MKVKLLIDIDDEMYNVHYTKGQIVNTLDDHPAAPRAKGMKLLKILGFGNYIYLKTEQYEKC